MYAHTGPQTPTETDQALPWKAVLFRPTSEGSPPQSLQEVRKSAQGSRTRRDRVVGKPTPQHSSEHSTRCHYVRVQQLPQSPFDRTQRTSHALRYRLASQSETPVLLPPPVMGEAQEPERLRPPLPSFRTIRTRKSPELQQSRLLRVHFQSELRESLGHRMQKPLRIAAMLKPQHKVIGVSHDVRFAPGLPLPPLPREPQVEHVVQVHVRQQRRFAVGTPVARRPPHRSVRAR